jgi:hypothetical protein
MLVDVKLQGADDPQQQAISEILAGSRKGVPRKHGTGLYEIGHWNFDFYLSDKWEPYPDLGEFGPYGVCDSPDQFMRKAGAILTVPDRVFVVSFVHLRKADESPGGGWRWHKWGEYIGEQDPQCEYLYDEPVIEEVWTYHVYEQMK